MKVTQFTYIKVYLHNKWDRSYTPKKNVYIYLRIIIWSFIAAAGAQSAPSHSIQVNGQALMYVEPDVANLNLGIEIQADSAANAQEQLRYQASMVLDALSREGIQRSKMKTSSYRISPVYSTETGKENYIEGYKAETSISVEISDLESLAMIIDKAIAAELMLYDQSLMIVEI